MILNILIQFSTDSSSVFSKPYPVEKIVEKIVHVDRPVEKIVERIVHVDRPVEKIVEKIVHVDRPVPQVIW